MKIFRRKNSGFGLIEILVTLGVLSVGILGVTTLHGVIARQSNDNKARSEALNIAQSRIEDMRNYTNAAGSVTGFNDLYDDTVGFENATAIEGISTDFTRSESITTTGTMKDVVVQVAWQDVSSVTQTVSLSTEFSFVSPRKVGDSALESSVEKVDSPTGRARLGDGTVTDEQLADENTVDNNDGTKELIDGTDRLLAVGNDVVLTLVEACQTEGGTCADFVRINGKVYVDRDALGGLPMGNINVIASDAAFCARSYVPSGMTEDERISVSNNDVTTVKTSAATAGEYEYFDYTCYLGGGWHGNVGLLISGNVNWDGCVGDPTTANAWAQPIRASRRVYRGMLYKIDENEPDGKEKVDGEALVQYYTQGIGDSVVLPPVSADTATVTATHDFVITGGFTTSQLENSNPCLNLGPMTRTDSNVNGTPGDLFEGIPDDFYCLNDGYTEDPDGLSTLDVIPPGFGVEVDDSYGNTCPYNPADPPATLHHVTGQVTISAPVTGDNNVLADGLGAFTSDGPGTCVIGSVSTPDSNTYTRDYDCIVYDWSTTINDVEVLNGWTGYIEVDYDRSSMSCDPNRISFVDQTTDSANNDFNNCSPGAFIYFTGTVIDAPNNRELQSVAISDLDGTCDLAVDGLSFTCLTAGFPDGVDAWTGTLTFTTDANIVCTGTGVGANPGVIAYTLEPSGSVSLNVQLSNNTGACL